MTISVRRTETPPEQLYPRAAFRAAERCTFDLTYHRAQRPVRIEPGYLGRELMDCSRVPGKSSTGGWEHMDDTLPDSDDLADWCDHYASMAIAQSLHEALEWFQVEGEPWLDPHDERMTGEVDELATQLAARLADLRRKSLAETREAA
jgi:hypothetical protein